MYMADAKSITVSHPGSITMVVSIEERREIARRNGAKSRGPKSDKTRFISSRNSLKHGCYALVHNPDDEDPLEDLALRDRWFADVGPRTVEEEFLTEQCFRAHRLSNRVERARQDQLAKQIEAATAPWHDQRDASVAKLWKELAVTNDATDVLAELRRTTLGIRALVQEVGRHRELLDTQGYWGDAEIGTMVMLSGRETEPSRMLTEDEDAYRLSLWSYQCWPAPPRDLIERMLEPANRPPGLRDVERDMLLPSRAVCLELLKQWVADMLAELTAESERVWIEVEAPELARRTGMAGLIRDANLEARIHRASNEYRAMYYKAHNTLEAIRKRAAAEAKEARKAERADSRRSDDGPAPAGRADHTASAPVVAPPASDTAAAPSASRPAASACEVEVEIGPETPRLAGPEVPPQGLEAQSRNEPSPATVTPGDITVAATAQSTGGAVGLTRPSADLSRGESGSAGGVTALTRPSADLSRGERCRTSPPRNELAPGAEHDWRTPPPTNDPPGSLAAHTEPLPYLLHPDTPWEELTPRARSAIEALNRDTMAEIRVRVEAMRSEQPLRE